MDKRAIEIKRILKKQYPEATFRVRIEKYSGGETIYRLLKDYYHIAYDEYSGEVLLGGNTYLDILPKEG